MPKLSLSLGRRSMAMLLFGALLLIAGCAPRPFRRPPPRRAPAPWRVPPPPR